MQEMHKETKKSNETTKGNLDGMGLRRSPRCGPPFAGNMVPLRIANESSDSRRSNETKSLELHPITRLRLAFYGTIPLTHVSL